MNFSYFFFLCELCNNDRYVRVDVFYGPNDCWNNIKSASIVAIDQFVCFTNELLIDKHLNGKLK